MLLPRIPMFAVVGTKILHKIFESPINDSLSKIADKRRERVNVMNREERPSEHLPGDA